MRTGATGWAVLLGLCLLPSVARGQAAPAAPPAAAGPVIVTVAADGSAQFTTIQEVI